MNRDDLDARLQRPPAPLADWLLVAFIGLLLAVGALGWAATAGGVIPA
jgi:hypothetical protein